jgi:D-sedoheptulose 7-phosphate isomerase
MTSRDVLLAITTSGKSPNIVRALEECRKLGATSLIFTGRDGGRVKALADYCIVVPGEDTGNIQEVHIVLGHRLCACVEAALCPA